MPPGAVSAVAEKIEKNPLLMAVIPKKCANCKSDFQFAWNWFLEVGSRR